MSDQADAPKKKDPLQGITLQMMIEHLVERYGWDGLGKRIEICLLYTSDAADD